MTKVERLQEEHAAMLEYLDVVICITPDEVCDYCGRRMVRDGDKAWVKMENPRNHNHGCPRPLVERLVRRYRRTSCSDEASAAQQGAKQ